MGRMAELLSDEKVDEALRGLTEWLRDGDALTRSAELGSFPEAIAVVNRIAEVAESNNHHPDIDIRWRKLIFRCSTHSEGGITAKDVSMAGEIDGVLDAMGS
jgi:4a-hydroxytetrahydrobiopterin dehydratase